MVQTSPTLQQGHFVQPLRYGYPCIPYVITKPLHHTQKLLSNEADGKIFSIKVILNFELEGKLLGFGAKIKVLGPRILVKQIKQQLAKMMERLI